MILTCQQKSKVSIEHIDGTLSARTRSVKLQWLSSEPSQNECRILSNARCLSEGVDVPALDAIIFLDPRSSQIDIVQSIGRVMRKSEGKKYGYVILPVIVTEDETPEHALDKNERYQTIWKVLQALHSHDERFENVVNYLIELREKVRVTSGNKKESDTFLNDILLEQYRQEIHIRMVRKCGGGYWETWIKDFVDAFGKISDRINEAINNPKIKERFDSFTEELRSIINPSITPQQAVEMLAQHITSKEIFDAIFKEFSGRNPISQAMQKMRTFIELEGTDLDPKGLENFDTHIRIEADKATTGEKKQELLKDIYNSFFKKAFKETSAKLGIVYTPVQIVDFILRSADWTARHELGINDGLGSNELHILDPFSGTGTFTARLIQLGLIPNANLGYKYLNEIHANELLLLAYYISAVNIEAAYNQITGGLTYIPFQGMVLADTFRLNNDKNLILTGPDSIPMFYEDGVRAFNEQNKPVRVIIGNPPYNVSGKIAEYEKIDKKIVNDYAKPSKATLKKALYDSYVRAIKWASERVNDTGGIVCYVTNASFIDNTAMDGMRQAEKLKELEERISFGEMMSEGIMTKIIPNRYYDWLNQRGDTYSEFVELGNKNEEGESIFGSRYSRGVITGHDAYSYNFSRDEICRNITILKPNALINDDTVRVSLYSPYVKEYLHFSRETLQRVYQIPRIFPKHDTKNLVICVSGIGSKKDFSVLMTDMLPSLSVVEICQCFPL